MTKIERLRAMPVIGNAYSDSELLRLAHDIAVDATEPLANRYEALWHMDRAMGLEPLDLTDAAACDAALSNYLIDVEGEGR